MRQRHNHKKGFELLRSNSETIAHKTRMGFSLLSSNSKAIGQPCKGFSLVEAAIVLGVVGVVIGAIWYATANFYEDYKVNKTVNDLQLIVRNVQNLVSIRDSATIGYAVNLNTTFRNAGVFPSNWIKGNSIKSPFGETVETMNYINPERFDIALYGITKSSCIKLAVKISSMAAQANRIHQNTSTFIWYISLTGSPPFNTTIFPIPIETAKTACNLDRNIVFLDAYYTRIN